MTAIAPADEGWPALALLYSESAVVEGFTWLGRGPVVIWGLEASVDFLHDVIAYDNPGHCCGAIEIECVGDSRFAGNSFICLCGRGNLLYFNVDPPYACPDPHPEVVITENLFWRVSTPMAWGPEVELVVESNNLGIAHTPSWPNNIFEDPLLCDPTAGDFRVAANSPNLPQNNRFGVLLGALGEGCGPIAMRPESWGSVKARYRP